MIRARVSSKLFLAVLLLLALVASSLPLTAQVPTTFNYQGRLLQNTGEQDAVLGSIDIVFSIWSGPASDGSALELWSESWTGVTLSNGIFSVLLGSNGSPLDPADFQGDTSLYLQFEIDGETLLPRQQLGSAPFAMVDDPGNEYQDLSLAGNQLALSNSAATVDLSGYLDNTDVQTLTLAANLLSISGSGSSVSLASYLDNTDVQTLTLTGNTLSISGSGSSVDLSGATDVADLAARVATIEDDLVRKVFVTSQSYDGDLGGLAGADAECQALADAAGLTGAYLAWLSDDGRSPRTRFGRLGVYELVDGTRVADDWSDLTDATLMASIDLTEEGASLGGDAVWTNTGPAGDGSGAAADCDDWTSASSGLSGGVGASSDAGSGWTDTAAGTTCDQVARLYCFEQFSYQFDDQRLTLAGNTLSISGSGVSVDLSGYLDNTDEQDLQLTGNTLSLSGDATSVDLAGYLDNTDDQVLSISGNNLQLSSDNGTDTVNLAGYLDNTDNQVLSISGNDLRLTSDDGTDTVSLASYVNTDGQTLGVSGNTLSISGGNSVSLAAFKDNTDSQDIASVLSNGTNAGDRDLTNLDDVDIDKLTVDNTFDCDDCITSENIERDTILGNDVTDRIFILHIECNGGCNDMSMRDACDVIENLRGLDFEVELVDVSCVHSVPSTEGNGFVDCDDGEEIHGNNECRAFELRTLGDLPCVNGDGTDVLVTCWQTDIAK